MPSTKLLTADDLKQYKVNLIEEYPTWFLLLGEDQRLIGRCYAWYRMPGEMQDEAFISPEHLLELRLIKQAWSLTMRQLFGMTHPNYEWLGNEIQKHRGHGHAHLIPRYVTSFTFIGEDCSDANFYADWGARHDRYVDNKPLPKRSLPPEKTQELIRKIRGHFQMFR